MGDLLSGHQRIIQLNKPKFLAFHLSTKKVNTFINFMYIHKNESFYALQRRKDKKHTFIDGEMTTMCQWEESVMTAFVIGYG